jgi:murein DD-endopeptidase MepM/ murein hydrolase activator NlpD
VPGSATPGTNPPANGNPGVPPPVDGPALAPSQLLPIFERAARLTGVPKEILLAIARVESSFTPTAIGPYIPQLAGTENEHALGMMQFLPGTYRMLVTRVDAATGKNLGMQGIWDPESAIYAAAFYLKDSGAPGDIRKALYAYNNADWYVDLIISWANTYAGGVVADPTLLNGSPNPGGSLTAPQNPLIPSNSRHIDMPSPIQLYAPWTAGETWHAGGEGSFYGDGFHTDAYGNYYTVDFNKGAWPRSEEDDGEPILAAADGIVNNIYQDSAGAWVVELYHVAPDGAQLRTLYVHLKTDPRLAPGIKVNQPVLHGTPIGLTGSTGESTGPHLHFGLWLLKDGQWVSIRAEPLDGRPLTNGANITSTNRPIVTDTTDRKLEFGFSPNSPSNADTVTIQAKGSASGLPVAKIEIYANTAKDGSIRGQWQPVGAFAGGSGQADWNAAPLAEGTYRLLLVQTDAAGNRAFHGLTDDTAVRYTIRRGEPRGSVVANPRADLALLAPLDGAALATLGGRGTIISGPLRFERSSGTVATSPLGTAAVVAATGAPTSGKIRDAEGLLVEEGTTNLITNPSFERGAEGWIADAPGNTFVVTPVESALVGKRSLRLDNSKGTAPAIFASRAGDGTVATWSIYARAIAVEGAGTAVPITAFSLGMAGRAARGHALGATWQRFTYTGTSGGGSTEVQVVVPAGAIIEVDGAQLEPKPYATSYTDGSLGSGYGWAGEPDASSSGRLATVVTLPLAGLVSAERGALSFWLTPTGPLAEGATLFALGEHLTLTVAGTTAALRWNGQALATVPWESGATHHYALTWQGGTLTFLQDGKVAGQGAIADFALPAGTQLALGSGVTGNNVANVIVQDLAVWQGAPGADIFALLAGGGQFLRPGVTETITLDTGLTLAAQGLAPGGIAMQFSFDGVAWTEPEPFATSKTLTLPAGGGEVRIYVRLTDEEGRTIVSTDHIQVVAPTKSATETTDGGR